MMAHQTVVPRNGLKIRMFILKNIGWYGSRMQGIQSNTNKAACCPVLSWYAHV